ncbi:MAG TPA: RNA polymerase sigma factor [Candidatus Polarisedimenticolaceae bacterium]|nr:RNA polymerase sigma factor [Candidatus Polarisedimenticolaceae bacterium]
MELVFPWSLTMTLGPLRDTAERELVAASREGDRAAFGELIRRHEHRVFRLAGRFFRGREDVEEVAQETFLTAWRRLGTYEARAPFEHWITRVCLRSCYARLGAERRRREPLSSVEPVAPARDPNAAIEVERLLARLAPADRFVLLLLDGEGWSVQEIAARIGWSATNVKVRAFRARRRLRALLEQG